MCSKNAEKAFRLQGYLIALTVLVVSFLFSLLCLKFKGINYVSPASYCLIN